MMRRFVVASSSAVLVTGSATVSVVVGAPGAGGVAPTTARAFSSNYGDMGNYKPPLRVGGRSGAHRRPAKQNYPQRSSSPTALEEDDQKEPIARATRSAGVAEEIEAEEGDSTTPAQRNYKNNYRDLFKPKKQPISFTSSFKADDRKGVPEPPYSRTSRGSHDDDDVTKIYSHEEVARIVEKDSGRQSTVKATAHEKRGARDVDVLRALEEDGEDGGSDVVTRTYVAEDDEAVEGDGNNDEVDGNDDHLAGDGAEDAHGNGTRGAEDKFTAMRDHPFYADLIKRVDRNMLHHRKDIRSTGRFSTEAINDCVRPLLQLTDYPFTTKELAQLANCINPVALAKSLPDRHACSRMRVYHSPDTDLLLDWSVEDFLRRRYESVHLSWEPMDVVCRRFGWTGDEMSDRDLLLYFSEFSEFVELAELEFGPNGKPRAIPITNAVERAEKAPISASRLLIRRVPDGEAEPSITEAIRLMGAPALSTQGGKGGHNHSHHHRGKRGARADSVAEMFSAVERAAEEVDGDEATKLRHGMDTVRSLKQATYPAGRAINEFAIGRRQAPANSKSGEDPHEDLAAEDEDDVGTATQNRPDKYDPDVYEELTNAFHKTKVEIAVLRRRLLGTESPAKAGPMQARLASQRRELSRLNRELRHMSALRQQQQMEAEEGKDEDDVEYVNGFTVPRTRPQYMEAPELDAKNDEAAANANDDDDDIDISEELQEYEQGHQPRATTTTTAAEDEDDSGPSHRSIPVRSNPLRKPVAHAKRTSPGQDLKSDFSELAEADDFDADEYVASGHITQKSTQHPPRTTNTNTNTNTATREHRKVAAAQEEEIEENEALDAKDDEGDDARAAAAADDDDDDTSFTTAVPARGRGKTDKPGRPQYMNAPERDLDEVMESAAAEEEDEDDMGISAAIAAYEAELQRPRGAGPFGEWKANRHNTESTRQRGGDAATPKSKEAAAPTRSPAAAEPATTAAADATTPRRGGDSGDGKSAMRREEDAEEAGGEEADTPLTRAEELAMDVERSSAAVDEARRQLEKLQRERDAAMTAFAAQVAQAADRLEEREATLAQALQNHREAVEAEAREAAEARAQAVEKELELQRQRRMAEVARQREQARLAQVEAQKAVARQKRAEEEALAKEKELEQKLAQVRAQLRAVQENAAASAEAEAGDDDLDAVEDDSGAGEPLAEDVTAAAAADEEEDVDGDNTRVAAAEEDGTAPLAAQAVQSESARKVTGDVSASHARQQQPEPQQEQEHPQAGSASNSNNSTSTSPAFMCSPEQYDGLHLAATRLRTEISALEQQMEQGGDEDDETLMAVLAESRSDLEELDDCILSVQQNAPWAAARDAKREQEARASATAVDSEAQRLQAEIDKHRFQIGLLEKRMHHATQRSVTNKLEQGIVAARREISRLRREQDRLRREGRDAFGLPASVSIAEALATEGHSHEKKRSEAEAALRAAAGRSADDKDASADAIADDTNAADGDRDEVTGNATASATAQGEFDDADDDTEANHVDASSPEHLDKTNADPEAHRLHLRLDSMLRDIQQLQDNIAIQERTTDYDDEETESVLLEMKNKLGQLLSLRDAVQQRLAGGGGGGAPVAPAPRTGADLVASHGATAGRYSGTHHHSGSVRYGATAAKKVRKVARNQRR